MKHLKITSHHESLASAVAELKPDLSCNPQVAADHIRQIDRNCKKAVIVGDEIYYVFDCDIRILHKFDPFVSCIDNRPMVPAFIVGNTLSIAFETAIPKTKAGRQWFKSNASLEVLAH